MDIHNRFMNVPTTGVTLLLDSLGDNPKAILDLAEKYNKQIRNGAAGSKTLEALRMILCYEYKSLHNVRSENDENIKESQANPLFVKPLEISDMEIKNFITSSSESWNKEDLALLYDILVLQLVIAGSLQQVTKLFDSFHEAHKESLATSNETLNLFLRVSECFADFYNLHRCLPGILGEEGELEEQRTRIQNVLRLWMKRAEHADWKLLAFLLPKLTLTFGSDKIVPPLWDEAFRKTDDLDTLNALCIMADACFPCERNTVKEIHYEQCMQEQFWLLLLRGLTSEIFQHRKQALYLAKRAIDFMDRHESKIRNMLDPSQESIILFVCVQLPPADPSIVKAKKSFFLILEALEEKPKHLVLPALSHLKSLSKMYIDHKLCRDCFNVVWLHCILKRILEHDNNTVKMFGLEATLESDLHIFDETFMNFLANVLNNPFLYQFDTYKDYEQDKPQILKLLESFFARSEEAEVGLINTIICAISRVSWCHVALFWILGTLNEIHSWTTDEMKCVVALFEKNVTMHCLSKRLGYQGDMILLFFKYYRISSQEDWDFIIDIVSSFPENVRQNWILACDILLDHGVSYAVSYVTRTCDTFFGVERNMKLLARRIALLVDSKLICRTDKCPAKRALCQLFENLIGADLRPHGDPASILVIIEFMSYLINLACHAFFECVDTMKRLISPYGDAIIKVVNKSLEKKATTKHDVYLLAITALVTSMDSNNVRGCRTPWWPDMEKQFERFEDKCMYIIANTDDFLQWCYAIKVLYICREKTFSRRPGLCKTYIPLLLRCFKSVIHADEHKERPGRQNGLPSGKSASDCFETIANLVYQVVTKSSSDYWPPDINWFEELRDFIVTESEQVIQPIAATLFHLLEKSPPLADQDLDTLNFTIHECWRRVFQLKRTKVFFSTVTHLTWLIVNSNFLKLDGAKEYAFECANEMMKEGERVPNLKQIFLNSMERLSLQDMSNFQKPFMSCLLHGSTMRRDKRIERRLIRLVAAGENSLDSELFVDIAVRAQSVIILLTAMTSPEAAEFRGNVLTDLLGILEQNKNKRYFNNSQVHRIKHRVMQTLLILEPFVNESEIQVLHDIIFDLVIAESNQPSVRLMQEWILTRIYLKNSTLRDSIWNVFPTAVEKRQESIVSLASIVFHVSRLLTEDTRTNYIAKAISHLLPNCMGQQSNVRLYSQTILVKIYGFLPVDSSEAKEYKEIFEGVEASLRQANLTKSSTRISDNVYFTKFHPIESYSLETIYEEFPRLAKVSYDEQIGSDIFGQLGAEYFENILSNYDPTNLSSEQVMLKSKKAAGEMAEETCPSTDEGLSGMSKKIISWKSMRPFSEELSEISKATLSGRKVQNEDAGIIVLASLIDRPSNLGGLARTCEMFGAKELVMRSLMCTKNREFQISSASAEKWITITEVKLHLLRNYLIDKQSKGWKLVGVEQTANSTNLLNMEFEKKTILLLGNEKYGIPANLISILDTCVEIPQDGVVRSLNVQVTGAICILQYFKQHICM